VRDIASPIDFEWGHIEWCMDESTRPARENPLAGNLRRHIRH
jgi:hypothetical protein